MTDFGFIEPTEIAKLTLHSKESITSTRHRLYENVFGGKGSPKNWDEVIYALWRENCLFDNKLLIYKWKNCRIDGFMHTGWHTP